MHLVGWSNSVAEPAFGSSGGGDASIKSKLINLMTSVRTLMRSTSAFLFSCFVGMGGVLELGKGGCYGLD